MLERLYEAGAFSYALLSGLITARAIWVNASPNLDALMTTYAVAYGTGIAARNAGRPFIAITQLVLTVMPVVVACLLIASAELIVLGVAASAMIVAMLSVIMSVFRTLREQIIAADVSAQMAEQMRDLARTDVVTGLANRAGLNHEMSEMLADLLPDSKLAMFWLDLDRFKEINDTLGHPIGDRVLAEIAGRLRKIAPEGASLARFGGDEFIVVAEVNDRGESERLARALNDAIGRPTRIEGQRIGTTASMGVALLPDDGPTSTR
jgi:diguanylate cyclase (GGDEF)-like protein